jgi:hypothetical protein
MNWSIEYSASQNLVKIEVEGVFAAKECLQMIENMLEREFWRPGLGLLVDYRKTNFSGLRLSELRVIAAFHGARNERIGGGKLAFLMGKMRDFGLARQFELVTEAMILSEVMVFLDEREALDWLTSND